MISSEFDSQQELVRFPQRLPASQDDMINRQRVAVSDSSLLGRTVRLLCEQGAKDTHDLITSENGFDPTPDREKWDLSLGI